MIGEHTVTATPVGGGPPVDLSCLVEQVKITHGRDAVDGQPTAATASLDLSFDTTTEDLPPTVDIGATITVTTTLDDDSQTTRFAGPLTDMVAEWEDAGTDTPNAAVMQLIAVGTLADLGSRVIENQVFPQELDGARVARILALAGVTTSPTTSDPGLVDVIPTAEDSQRALDAAQEVADSAAGLLWHTRSGEIRYADSDHRRGAVPVHTFDACDIEVTPTWRRDTGGLINTVSIGYGVPPDGGQQPRFTETNVASQTRYGHNDISVSSVLADLPAAESVGRLLLTRNANPVWLLQEIPLDLEDMDTPTTAAVLALEVHDLVQVTGMPVMGALPSTAAMWVEGFTETLSAYGHEYHLYVSGYCRTSPAPRWDDVPTTTLWDTVTGTWDEWTCLGAGVFPSEGRWADVPASTRWDHVDPGITWDEWNAA